MYPLNVPEIHLSPTPDPNSGAFPECLRGEVVELAEEIHKSRLAGDLISDPLDNWLEAETQVIARHLDVSELVHGSEFHN